MSRIPTKEQQTPVSGSWTTPTSSLLLEDRSMHRVSRLRVQGAGVREVRGVTQPKASGFRELRSVQV